MIAAILHVFKLFFITRSLLLGADLNNLVNQAAIRAAVENDPYVTMKHLEWAKDKIIMGKPDRAFRFYFDLQLTVSQSNAKALPVLRVRWWYGRAVKAKCFESCGVFLRGFESRCRSYKPQANSHSAVRPFEAGKRVLGGKVLGGSSEGTSRSAAGPHQLHSCQKPSLR